MYYLKCGEFVNLTGIIVLINRYKELQRNILYVNTSYFYCFVFKTLLLNKKHV